MPSPRPDAMTMWRGIVLCRYQAPRTATAMHAAARNAQRTLADSEIAAIGKLYPMNARPTQPLNGRTIKATR